MALKKDAILGDVYVSLTIVVAVPFLANIFFLRVKNIYFVSGKFLIDKKE